MQTMALVISIDSMPAHLAGAPGVPVWTLLPCEADWRWLEQRSDRPWYPAMRLFRQSRPGEWDDVLCRVHHALASEMSGMLALLLHPHRSRCAWRAGMYVLQSSGC
jgi:hypothetical protein